jgi:hypothetical protein
MARAGEERAGVIGVQTLASWASVFVAHLM